MTLVLRYAARSDRGLVRSSNQDAVYAGPRLLAVADGMGGHAAGEVASKVVIAAMAPLDDEEPGDDLVTPLSDAVAAGNGAISELVAGEPEMDGMGTTLTAVLFATSRIGLVHIGDSRAYLRRAKDLTQVTHDDSFVQSLVDEGRITPDEAAAHPQRSLLLKALTGHEVDVHPAIREARAGDRYMLCSDGLSGFVSHETLAEAITIRDPDDCANRMIELALKAGGPDNVTVIVADVVDVHFGEDEPIVGGSAGDETTEPPAPDSPAARAIALEAEERSAGEPPTEAAEAAEKPEPTDTTPGPAAGRPPRRRRHRHTRLFVLIGVVILVLAAAVAGTRYWVLQQYYIAADSSGDVAIFQGVQGSALGLSLHRRVEGSCPSVTPGCRPHRVQDFSKTARTKLHSGITGLSGLSQARAKVRQLERQYLLPPCPPHRDERAAPRSAPSSSGPAAQPGDRNCRKAR
jgi:protein phosphatase